MNLPKIEDGAIFIADAHYPHHGYDLLRLLHRINNGEIDTPQIFMMGDNFDLLIGGVESTYSPNAELIKLINDLSKKKIIYYFEGNHDFELREVFPEINVYNIEMQPQYMQLGELRVGLSHGDKFATSKAYEIMTKVARNKKLHKGLSFIENIIVEKINSKLKTKEICNQIDDFDDKVTEIYRHYKLADMVIEGHYHQARVIGSYVSLPSLACQKQIAIAKGENIAFIDVGKL